MKYVFKKRYLVFLASLFDFFGGLFTLPIRVFWRSSPGNVGSILIIRLDHLGDVVCSVPVPENLKNHYVGSRVTCLVSGQTKEIFMNNQYVDEVISYDASWFDRSQDNPFELRSFLRLAAQLRKYKYDLGIDLRGDLRHILLMVLAGVKFRVGYGVTGGGFLLHRSAEYMEDKHVIERNLDLIKGLGVTIINHEPKLYSSKEEEALAEDFLQKNNIAPNDFIAVVHACAGYPSKNWLDERFSRLVFALCKDYNAKVILLGLHKDKDRNEGIIKNSHCPAIDAAGRTSLGTLLYIIKRANIFIGVDSGPSHVAASLKIPSIVLYSGTNRLGEWGPRSDKAVILQKDIPCKDCERLYCTHNVCMDLISVEDVLEAIKKVIRK